MKDIEKILVEILLCITAAIFVLLLFNSCKTHKQTIKTAIDSTATEAVQIESHTTDNSKSEEDYTEITYVLDSGQTVIVNFGDGKVNYGSEELKVTQIKVKNSHITGENRIENKIYATEKKTAEIKEKSAQIEKTKPNTTQNLRIVAVLFSSIIIILALWRFYQKMD